MQIQKGSKLSVKCDDLYFKAIVQRVGISVTILKVETPSKNVTVKVNTVNTQMAIDENEPLELYYSKGISDLFRKN